MDKHEYNKNYYKLKTIERDECFVCKKHYKPTKYGTVNSDGLMEIEIFVGHHLCCALVKKR